MKTAVVQKKHRGGRPTKKTEDTIKRLFDGIRRGIPYTMCCELAGISEDTFFAWRHENPEFNEEVLRVTRESVFTLLDTLKEAHQQSWQSAAFMLERRWPKFYGRAEAQLNFLIQQNNINTSANAQSFETVVLSDLQFSELSKNPNYQHRKAERPISEMECEVTPVDENLSGVLVKAGHPLGAIVSESQAESNQARAHKAAQRIDELLRAKRAGNGNAESLEAATSSQMVLAPITMPAGEPTESWWTQFVSGSDRRQVEKSCAITVIRRVMTHLVGEQRAKTIPIEYESDLVTLGDIYGLLEELTGGIDGWRTLVKFSGRA
jgi:hypothetical protein